MDVKARIQEDMKSAMRSGERERLTTLRMALAAIKQREIDERKALGDPEVLAVLEKMVKQRRESIAQFEGGGRADLAAKESAEITVLRAYLPEPLDASALEALIGEAIAETSATTLKDMGKVMAVLKAKASGRADMAAVGARVKQRLS